MQDLKNRNLNFRRKHIRQEWDIECNDTISKMNTLGDNNVDLIFTSPPYYGVADYIKAQRLSFLWFHEKVMKVEGYSYNDFEQLRKKETGARSKRHSKSSFDDYIKYMTEYINECHRILKTEGFLVLIIGDSKSRKETIEVINNIANECGFSKEFQFQRQIKHSRRRLMAKVENEQISIYIKK